jgi:3-oxoacyl-[acyl-carrier protein] reductase
LATKEIEMNTPTNRVAVITGASRGIGAAIAERLAADGFAVIINYAGSTGEAEALVGRIEKAGGRAITAQADVSDPGAVGRMFDAAEAAYGGVDVLVNNAGIMHLGRLRARHLLARLEATCCRPLRAALAR